MKQWFIYYFYSFTYFFYTSYMLHKDILSHLKTFKVQTLKWNPNKIKKCNKLFYNLQLIKSYLARKVIEINSDAWKVLLTFIFKTISLRILIKNTFEFYRGELKVIYWCCFKNFENLNCWCACPSFVILRVCVYRVPFMYYSNKMDHSVLQSTL